MNEGLKKFEELIKTDTAFQEKLKDAMESYTGEQTEQAVFEAVLVPFAKEYGISATFGEYKEYINDVYSKDRELSEDEVDQVAGGGKGGGFGITECCGIGVGAGGSAGSESGAVCLMVGAGYGTTHCVATGTSDSDYQW